MQFQFEHEMGTIRLRFLVEDPDATQTEVGLPVYVKNSLWRCKTNKTSIDLR
jgi:hypothetical protein